MSFVSPDCDDIVGKTVVCLPVYGWGWSRDDTCEPIDFLEIVHAGLFTVHVQGFFHYEERRNGIYGKIVSKPHLFSDLLIEGTIMSSGESNFTDRLAGRFDVQIGPVFPDAHGYGMTNGVPRYNGYCFVARNIKTLRRDKRAGPILADYERKLDNDRRDV